MLRWTLSTCSYLLAIPVFQIIFTLLFVITIVYNTQINAISQSQKIKQYGSTAFKMPVLAQYNQQLATIAKYALPAVVNIVSAEPIYDDLPLSPFDFFDNDSLLNPFSDQSPDPFNNQSKTQHQHSLGSGFIISTDGTILTNHHIIKNAHSLMVTLSDNTSHKATLIGSDPETNIALLKIKSKSLPYFELADSDRVQVGELVIALGNPFGIGPQFTTGFISGTSRHNIGVITSRHVLQTNMIITPGNSGGPLLNINGDVIGMNTAISARSGGSQGSGSAIPSHILQTVITSLKQHGQVLRSYLGVHVQNLTPQIATAFDIKNTQKGALIRQVIPQSPAERAGLKNGDIIISFNQKPIDSDSMLRNDVVLSPPHKSIPIRFLRGNTVEKRYVTLATLSPSLSSIQERTPILDHLSTSLSLVPLSNKIKERHQFSPALNGVFIEDIEINGTAARNGLQRHDIILSINNVRITSPKVAYQLIKTAQKNQNGLVLLVHRQHQNYFILVDQ